MRWYWFFIATLGIWRITHLLNAEDGPWDLIFRLRQKAGEGFWGKWLDCFYCLSLWIAVPFTFLCGENWKEQLLLWPALSAGAILLERITHRASKPTPVFYSEETENENVLLRQKKRDL